jgi:dimeric dUTPase (all-alpha-NTP-PPase superfamily)
MTTKEIKKATAKMSYENAISFIESLGMNLKVWDSMPCMKVYRVNNNNEICGIIITKKIYDNDLANVAFTFNH